MVALDVWRRRAQAPRSLFDFFSQDIDSAIYPSGFLDKSFNDMIRPATDIHETENNFVLKVDLAGVKQDEISVETQGSELIISGEKKHEYSENKKDFHLSERSFGKFRRSFYLPDSADLTSVHAVFKDGVLQVEVAKKAIATTKKIQINS